MYVTILDSNGGRREGILLAAGEFKMRVGFRGCTDTVELRRTEGHWVADDGEPVELESLVADAALGGFYSEMGARALAAGGCDVF